MLSPAGRSLSRTRVIDVRAAQDIELLTERVPPVNFQRSGTLHVGSIADVPVIDVVIRLVAWGIPELAAEQPWSRAVLQFHVGLEGVEVDLAAPRNLRFPRKEMNEGSILKLPRRWRESNSR
jgi:hypothetical protein